MASADRELLDQIARHPFLSAEELAIVMDRELPEIEDSVELLSEFGFVRLAAELGGESESIEATVDGLELAAAQNSLPFIFAIRHLGLVGGGPDQATGSRAKLVANFAHTRGADRMFVNLAAALNWRRIEGRDGALLEWRNATACSRSHTRPDGYGLIRYDDERYGFFLEFDRGTMRFRDYLEKFDAYYRFRNEGRFKRDYHGFPTILFVTTGGRAAEKRIAQAAGEAAVSGLSPLPVLITRQWRIQDPRNPDGFFGTIWWDGAGDARRRRRWPHLDAKAEMAAWRWVR